MKSIIRNIGIIAVAAVSFASCNKEIEKSVVEDPIVVEEGIPFEIVANPATKTTTDGLQTKWADGDAINLFHAVAGSTTYVLDNQFSTTADGVASGSFTGTLKSALADGSYDWYAMYPYTSNANLTSVENTVYYQPIGSTYNGHQTQTGNSSTAHLSGSNFPLYGHAENVAHDATPAISLSHIASIVKVSVTNKNDDPLVVTSVSFAAPEGTDIIGTYKINYKAGTMVKSGDSYVSNVANLTVSGGTAIAKNETAYFYLGVRPFSVDGSSTPVDFKVTINGREKTVTVSKAVTFASGKINTVKFDYDFAPVPDYVTLPWESAAEGEGVTKSVLSAMPGVVSVSADSDYSTGPCFIKFTGNSHCIIIKTDSSIGDVSVNVKANGSPVTSQLVFSESVDGSSWTEVQKITIATAVISTTNPFATESRYLKIGFVKNSANAGIGRIAISKPSTDPIILATDITNVPAAGVTNAVWTYTASNFADDVEVASYTGCVTDAIADAGEIVYSVGPNYTSANVDGTIVLQSASDNSITKTISVSQLKSALSVSAETVTIPADSENATFTVTTAEFGYDAVVASVEDGKNLSISNGGSGSANASAQTVTVSSSTSAPTEGDAIILGTVTVYRNGNASDPQKKTITVKKAKLSSGKSYTVTWNSSNNSKGVQNYTSSWSVTADGITCNMQNWNNNSNGWNYVRCGSKNAASVATIVTSAAIPEAIKTVKLTIDSVTASNINSLKLYVSDSTTFGEAEGSFTVASGTQSVVISSPAANKYYKIEVDCKKGGSNGFFQLSELVFTTGD